MLCLCYGYPLNRQFCLVFEYVVWSLPSLDLVEGLQLGNGDEDDNGLLAVAGLDLDQKRKFVDEKGRCWVSCAVWVVVVCVVRWS
jgi:hypothetical protein